MHTGRFVRRCRCTTATPVDCRTCAMQRLPLWIRGGDATPVSRLGEGARTRVCADAEGEEEAAVLQRQMYGLTTRTRRHTDAHVHTHAHTRTLSTFQVYVYPLSAEKESKLPAVYRAVRDAIRRGPYATTDPDEACLFVPSVDVSCWCEGKDFARFCLAAVALHAGDATRWCSFADSFRSCSLRLLWLRLHARHILWQH